MIELYGISSPNVLKVMLMLEEVHQPYELHRIDIWAEEQFTSEFRALNPNCKVPVIIDNDGPNGDCLILSESGAILLYLAEKYNRFLPALPRDRAITYQWLMLQMGSIGPMFGQANHFRRSAPPGNDYAKSRYGTEVRRLYDVLAARLEASPYLAGDGYTIADMATWPWVAGYAEPNGVDLDKLPAVRRWVDAIGQRPATVRAKRDWPSLEAFAMERRANADPDKVDRLFGRGRYARV